MPSMRTPGQRLISLPPVYVPRLRAIRLLMLGIWVECRRTSWLRLRSQLRTVHCSRGQM